MKSKKTVILGKIDQARLDAFAIAALQGLLASGCYCEPQDPDRAVDEGNTEHEQIYFSKYKALDANCEETGTHYIPSAVIDAAMIADHMYREITESEWGIVK